MRELGQFIAGLSRTAESIRTRFLIGVYLAVAVAFLIFGDTLARVAGFVMLTLAGTVVWYRRYRSGKAARP